MDVLHQQPGANYEQNSPKISLIFLKVMNSYENGIMFYLPGPERRALHVYSSETEPPAPLLIRTLRAYKYVGKSHERYAQIAPSFLWKLERPYLEKHKSFILLQKNVKSNDQACSTEDIKI